MIAMKRTVATLLWGYAFWYLGAFLASTFSAPEVFGPILGIAAAALIAVDPRGLFWPRPATHPNPRIASRLSTMTRPEGAH